jgi:hypothetical protein
MPSAATIDALDVVGIIAGWLDPTPAYAQRSFVFVPSKRFSPGWDGSYGHLSCMLARSGRGWAKTTRTLYLVEELDRDSLGIAGRVFLLVKPDDENQVHPYQTIIADDPRRSACSCEAGTIGKRRAASCIHRDAIREVIDRGGFDPDE